jgi:hypothetical protein
MSLRFYKEELKSLKGKIVVFKSDSKGEIQNQGINPVLFIDEKEVYTSLKRISSIDNMSVLDSELARTLEEYYQYSVLS